MTPTAPPRMRRGLVPTPVGAIEYLELGAGPPLLALHPTPGSCLWYADVAPLLSGERRVIAMTTMGYGRSDRPDPPYTTVRQYAEAAIAFLDALGVERASVLGSHTGSLLAVEIAAGWPQRVDRLVLGEPFNWNTPARREALTRQHTYARRGRTAHTCSSCGGGRGRTAPASTCTSSRGASRTSSSSTHPSRPTARSAGRAPAPTSSRATSCGSARRSSRRGRS